MEYSIHTVREWDQCLGLSPKQWYELMLFQMLEKQPIHLFDISLAWHLSYEKMKKRKRASILKMDAWKIICLKCA